MSTFRRIDDLLDKKTSEELAKDVAARRERTHRDRRHERPPDMSGAENTPPEHDAPPEPLRTGAPGPSLLGHARLGAVVPWAHAHNADPHDPPDRAQRLDAHRFRKLTRIG